MYRSFMFWGKKREDRKRGGGGGGPGGAGEAVGRVEATGGFEKWSYGVYILRNCPFEE